jgi:leader peptidase (prepilin peptidase)/N-methyltransferase
VSLSVALVVLASAGGLAVGSFLNVVVWRVPRKESVVTPASRCPVCSTQIRPRDNVPVVSWLLLRAKCRDCRAPISARYPAVELATAVTFGLLAWRLEPHWRLMPFLYLAAVGIALAVIDLDIHKLPDALTLPSYVVGAALLTAAAFLEHDPKRLITAGLGMAILYAGYYALMIAKPGGMGFGDVKLAGVLGMYLGFLGWGALAVGAFLAFLLGGVGGVVLILAGSAGRKSKIPFGPYMVAGALIGALAGSSLAHAYTHTFLS